MSNALRISVKFNFIWFILFLASLVTELLKDFVLSQFPSFRYIKYLDTLEIVKFLKVEVRRYNYTIEPGYRSPKDLFLVATERQFALL